MLHTPARTWLPKFRNCLVVPFIGKPGLHNYAWLVLVRIRLQIIDCVNGLLEVVD